MIFPMFWAEKGGACLSIPTNIKQNTETDALKASTFWDLYLLRHNLAETKSKQLYCVTTGSKRLEIVKSFLIFMPMVTWSLKSLKNGRILLGFESLLTPGCGLDGNPDQKGLRVLSPPNSFENIVTDITIQQNLTFFCVRLRPRALLPHFLCIIIFFSWTGVGGMAETFDNGLLCGADFKRSLDIQFPLRSSPFCLPSSRAHFRLRFALTSISSGVNELIFMYEKLSSNLASSILPLRREVSLNWAIFLHLPHKIIQEGPKEWIIGSNFPRVNPIRRKVWKWLKWQCISIGGVAVISLGSESGRKVNWLLETFY